MTILIRSLMANSHYLFDYIFCKYIKVNGGSGQGPGFNDFQQTSCRYLQKKKGHYSLLAFCYNAWHNITVQWSYPFVYSGDTTPSYLLTFIRKMKMNNSSHCLNTTTHWINAYRPLNSKSSKIYKFYAIRGLWHWWFSKSWKRRHFLSSMISTGELMRRFTE